MTLRMARMSCSFAAIAAVTFASGAVGQTVTSSSASGESSANTDIVVTAQRRSERLQDVPISVQNLSSQQLVDANIQNIQEIGKITPALRFDSQGAFVQPTIRGIGTSVVTSGSGSNVGIYIDGFYSPNPVAAEFDLLSVENVQVLKGPQGTLFGRNTTGGAILVTTAKPSQETRGILDVSYGSYNAQRYQGYFTTGLTQNIAFDVGAQLSRGDGYVNNVVTGSDNDARYENWQVRTGLKIDPTSNLSLLFRYEHSHTNDPFQELTSVYVSDGQPIYPPTIAAGGPTKSFGQPLSSAVFLPNPIYGVNPGDTAITSPVYVHQDNDVFQLTSTLGLDFGTLSSYTQYRNERSDQQQSFTGATPNTLEAHVPIHDRTFSQEFLLSSNPGGKLQWTVGAFYFDYKDRFQAYIAPPGVPFFQVAGSNSDTRSIAAFADATYQVADKLFLTAGMRYSHDEVRDAYYQVLGATGLSNVYAPVLKNNKVTPRAVIRYAVDPDTSIYASYTQGYKAGIYNLGGQSLAAIKPEKLNAYEVGLKHAEHAFSVELAGFYYDYKNLQVSNYGVVNGVPVGFVSNAANARIYGADLQARWNVTPDFEFNVSGAYINAKYKKYDGDPAFSVCTNDPTGALCQGDVLVNSPVQGAGLTMQRAPRWTATAGARYGLDTMNGRLTLSGTLSYSSKIFFDPADQFKQNAYATLGLRAEWTDHSQRLTLAVYGDNVTDKRYYTGVLAENTATAATWNAPATFGGEIRFRFN